jgi:hypothetical protein
MGMGMGTTTGRGTAQRQPHDKTDRRRGGTKGRGRNDGCGHDDGAWAPSADDDDRGGCFIFLLSSRFCILVA